MRLTSVACAVVLVLAAWSGVVSAATISWSTPVQLATGVANDNFNSPTIMPYGNTPNWVAIWKGSGGGLYSRVHSGTSWGSTITITSQADGGAAFTLQPSPVAFWGYNNGIAYATFSTTKGAWSQASFPGSNPVGTCGRNPSVSADVYDSNVLLVHEGYKCNGQLFYTFWTGTTFNVSGGSDAPIKTSGGSTVGTSGGTGQGQIMGLQYNFHQGQGNDGALWYTYFDGTNWATDTKTTSTLSSQPEVGLAASINELVLTYQRGGKIYWNTFDGTVFGGEQAVDSITQGIPSNNNGAGIGIYKDTVRISYVDINNVLWYTDGTISA